MRLRGIIALTTLAGGLGLAGWAATGISSWAVVSLDIDDSAPAAAAAAPTSRAMSVGAKSFDSEAPSAARLIDSSLFNPQPMQVEPAVRAVVAAAYQAPSVRVEAAPPPASPALQPQARKLIDPKEPGGFTAAQVARIKANLRLTSDQEEYWRPVEQVLLEIVRDTASQKAAGRGRITVSAEASQRLYWAAGPLLMSLREDQRREARSLARSMGLEKVASLI
jgi:hypothetical protein